MLASGKTALSFFTFIHRAKPLYYFQRVKPVQDTFGVSFLLLIICCDDLLLCAFVSSFGVGGLFLCTSNTFQTFYLQMWSDWRLLLQYTLSASVTLSSFTFGKRERDQLLKFVHFFFVILLLWIIIK